MTSPEAQVSSRRATWRRPVAWPVWALPRPALVWVLFVYTVTCLALVVSWIHVSLRAQDLILAAILVSLALVHTEVVVDFERERRKMSQDSGEGHFDLSSAWTVAAALLLPPALSAVLAFVVMAHLHLRSWRPAKVSLYRALYSSCTVVLASVVAASLLQLIGFRLSAGVASLAALGTVLLVLIAYFVINNGLVVVILNLAEPATPFRKTIGTGGDNLMETATIGLGGILATTLIGPSPWMAVILLPFVLIMQRAYGVQRLELAASFDTGTGLLTSTSWHRQARKELRRAARRGQPAAVALVDIDGFRRVNARWGHLAADQILAATGKSLTSETGPDDLVGRFGPDEFALLLTHLVEPSDVDEVLAALGRAVTAVAPADIDALASAAPASDNGLHLTASIGCAHFPDSGLTLEDLLAAAQRSLNRAKAAGPGLAVVDSPRRDTSVALPNYLAARRRRFD